MLDDTEVRELARVYRQDKARRAAAPRPAEARRRLVAVAEAAEAYAAALAELGRHEAELADLTDDDVADRADEGEGEATLLPCRSARPCGRTAPPSTAGVLLPSGSGRDAWLRAI